MKIERLYHFRISIILVEMIEKTKWLSMADNVAVT